MYMCIAVGGTYQQRIAVARGSGTVFSSGQTGSTLMGSLQKYYLLTESAFGSFRQNYVPLCVFFV